MSTAQRTDSFHHAPVIGHPEAYYVQHAREAEQAGDIHARAACKVGQYVTLGLDRDKPWPQKLQCFNHALKHYCTPPEGADDSLKAFYAKLGEVVRRHAGHEALRLAREKQDEYAIRQSAGATKEEIADDAEIFFPQLLGHEQHKPAWFTEDAWRHLRELEQRWV
jgi:hypothetical protein